jgi:archaeosine synthase
MLGKVKDEKIKQDFLQIETDRVAEYLEKTQDTYRFRLGYCIGLFRQALIQGSQKSGIPIDIICPSMDTINSIIAEEDCPFQEGSLSMEEYLEEFHAGLCTIGRKLVETL